MTSRELKRMQDDEKKILNRYLLEYPVKLGQLAKELGVAIKVSTLPRGISGRIRSEAKGYTIRVNRYESRERQRFTIAHEIAHFLLHRSFIDSTPDGIEDNVLYRSGASERIEFEANRLAADIAMPMGLVKKTLAEFDDVVTEETIKSLAARFQVSKAAMEIRLSSFAAA